VLGYYVNADGGGGVFSVGPTTAANGGTIINDASGRSWYRQYTGSVYAQWFGAVGDGATDDTVALQASINANQNGVILLGPRNYYVTSGLTSAGKIAIIGENGGAGIYSATITSGFVAGAPNINLLTLNGGSSLIQGVGFYMYAGELNTSGAAVTFDSTAQSAIRDCQINYPYIGIDVTGSSTEQNNSQEVRRNVIVSPVFAGIRLGVNSVGGNTVDTRITDNAIYAAASNTAVGLLMLDAGGFYIRGNDMYQMGYGTKIFPGAGQFVTGFAYDVLGDTSYYNDLLIDSNGGEYTDLMFTNTWASDSLGTSVLIQNSGAGTAGRVAFVGHKTILNLTPAAIAFDIEAGIVSLQDSQVGSKDAAPSSTAIKIGSGAVNPIISGLKQFALEGPSGSGMGSVGTGIYIDGNAVFQIQNNNLIGATIPILFTPSDGNNSSAIISGNLGVDNIIPQIASAPTITAPLNPAFWVTGTTEVTTIDGGWAGREMVMIAINGLTFATGGNIINSITAAAETQVLALYDAGVQMWRLK
jgi:hypothetical protein